MSGYVYTKETLDRIRGQLLHASDDLQRGMAGGPPTADAGESSAVVGRAMVTVTGFAMAMAQLMSLSAHQIDSASGTYQNIETAAEGELDAKRQLAAMGVDGPNFREHSGPLLDAGQDPRHRDGSHPMQNWKKPEGQE